MARSASSAPPFPTRTEPAGEPAREGSKPVSSALKNFRASFNKGVPALNIPPRLFEQALVRRGGCFLSGFPAGGSGAGPGAMAERGGEQCQPAARGSPGGEPACPHTHYKKYIKKHDPLGPMFCQQIKQALF